MAEPHIVTTLAAKRKEIERQINLLTKRLEVANAELETIKTAQRIFKDDLTPSAPRIEPPAFADYDKRSIRIIFEVLRSVPSPVSAWHLTELVMKERGIPFDDIKLCRKIEQRVRASLNYYRRKRGILRSSRDTDGTVLWELVPFAYFRVRVLMRLESAMPKNWPDRY